MRNFSSSNFAFRPTSLGQRMAEAGLVQSAHLVREPHIEVIRGKKHQVIIPDRSIPGAFGKKVA